MQWNAQQQKSDWDTTITHNHKWMFQYLYHHNCWKQSGSDDIEEFGCTVNQPQSGICRVYIQYTQKEIMHIIFTTEDHILSEYMPHVSVNFKRLQIKQSLCSDHNKTIVNQFQKDLLKTHKHLKAKHHTSTHPLNQRDQMNQKGV